MQCLCRPFRDWVRILLIWEGLRVCIERSWWRRWLWHLVRMRYGCPPWWGVPGTSHWEEAPGMTQDTWERFSQLAWEHFWVTLQKVDELTEVKEVWASLLELWPMRSILCISIFLIIFFILSDLLCAAGSHLANAFTYSLTTSPYLLQPFAVIIFCLFYKCVCACTDYELERKAGRTGLHLPKWRGKYRSDASAPRNTL